jgi:hypothetical protein
MSTSRNRSPSRDHEERPLSPPYRELEESRLNDSEHPVLEISTLTSDEKYGFIIFRTVYDDENDWERFMVYLNAQVRASMESKGLADEIPNIDWKVQSSPDLEDASFDEIRRWMDFHIRIQI